MSIHNVMFSSYSKAFKYVGRWMKNSLECPAKEADRITKKWKIKTLEYSA